MKREDLPLVTPAQFMRFKPCWFRTAEGRTRYERVAAKRAGGALMTDEAVEMVIEMLEGTE